MFLISCGGSGNPSDLVTEEMQAATSRLLPGLYASDVRGTRDASKAHAPLGSQGDGMRL